MRLAGWELLRSHPPQVSLDFNELAAILSIPCGLPLTFNHKFQQLTDCQVLLHLVTRHSSWPA